MLKCALLSALLAASTFAACSPSPPQSCLNATQGTITRVAIHSHHTARQPQIRCQGPRIRLYINGTQTIDFTEADPKIPLTGVIAIQIHSGPPTEAWYRNITLTELKTHSEQSGGKDEVHEVISRPGF